jgi:hypothetical protein
MNIDLVLGILHCVRGEFPNEVSGTAVGPIFTGHESEGKKMSTGNSHHTSCKIPKTKNLIT